MTGALVRYEAARAALAEAHRVDEVKDIRDKAHAIAAYARQANDTAMVEWATEIKVRAERRAGELLHEMEGRGEKAGRGRPANSDTAAHLSDFGISAKQSERFKKLAAVPQSKFEQAVEAAKEVAREVTTTAVLRHASDVHVSNNSGNAEWYTPPRFVEAARNVMGSIDTDPASSEFANRLVGATEYFDARRDGREQRWSGNVWMNPPYGQPLCADFCEAVVQKYGMGEIAQACVLVNNGTETAWFQHMLHAATAVCFPKGRISFLDSAGKASLQPLQGQAVFYFGPNSDAFASTFGQFGAVLRG